MIKQPVMILAGGTGGHVFPALAVASELKRRGTPVIWVGTKKGIEAKVIPAAGIKLETMHIQGLRGKGITLYLRAPFIIGLAMLESVRIILKHKPCAMLGMGGFVSGPCALVGVVLRKPLIIHEQNAIVGLTNRILAPLSKVMFTGFPLQYKKVPCEYCGNPVRDEFRGIADPETRFNKRVGNKRLLIIGGSLGAKALNDLLPQAVKIVSQKISLDVWHQTGEKKLENVRYFYQQHRLEVKVDEFIVDVAEAYSWADLVVCRSGAITLAEVAAVGLGSILVPYPHAVDDHQTANAQSFVKAGAACLLRESDMSVEKMSSLLLTLLSDKHQLANMANAAKKLGTVDAGRRVADECQSVCGYSAMQVKS